MINSENAAAPRIAGYSRAERLMILAVFALCLLCASLIPRDQCPDEAGRMQLVQWMCDTNALPTGDEPETIITGWGFSYALRPYLSAIVGAFFMKAASLISRAPWFLRLGSRMCSVLAVTGCCYYCLRLGHRVFARRSSALLMAAFVCFLPQVIFLGSYLNNDSLSLLAVCMLLYYLAEGRDTAFAWRSCVGLAIALSIGALSHYSIYGWLLGGVVFCVAAALRDRRVARKARFILGRGAAIGGLCLLLAGWFFLRSAALHSGDFLGLQSEIRSRERLLAQGETLYPYVSLAQQGLSLGDFIRYRDYEWFRFTSRSFIGVFRYMTLYLPAWRYGAYYAVIWLGILLFAAAAIKGRKADGGLLALMLSAGATTMALSFLASYLRDYEPLGRYVISLAPLLGYLLAYGADRLKLSVSAADGKPARLPLAEAITAIWLALFAHSFLGTMAQLFEPLPF